MHVRGNVGAVATQALVNPFYSTALDAMTRGDEPAAIIAALTAADPGREHRQVHLIDARGRAAAFTGSSCIDWCGHLCADDYSIAGNMLEGPRVLEATADAYESSRALPFGERLIAAMAAGEAAGGDKRGRQAAGLRICTTEDYPALDLRVDDHSAPIDELARLYAKSLERFVPFVTCLPTRDNPAGTCDREQVEAAVEEFDPARSAL